MAPLPLPTSLSPSRLASFTSCGLAFKLSAIDRLPEPASVWTAKGTLVHLALERLHADLVPAARTPAAAAGLVREAVAEVLAAPECADLDLEDPEAFVADAEQLAANAFLLEDPTRVRAVGLELKLEATTPDGLVLRGVIDRLDLRPDGSLVVVDYKTGAAPRLRHEAARLAGVHLYAYLVEQNLGVAPSSVELLHLREPLVLACASSERTRSSLQRRTSAAWAAIEQACATDGFEPQPGPLCGLCAFRSLCPAWPAGPAEAGAGPQAEAVVAGL